jgi:hypothetical protein
VHGLKPNATAVEKPRFMKELPLEDEGTGVARQRSVVLRPPSPSLTDKDDNNLFEDEEPLVAVKMMARTLCDADDRMRISFVREVEVLRVSTFTSLQAIVQTIYLAYIPPINSIILAFIHDINSSCTNSGTYTWRRALQHLE